MQNHTIDEYKNRITSSSGDMIPDPEIDEPIPNEEPEDEELSHSQLVDGMYVEPRSYFTKEMLEAVKKYDKKHGTNSI